MEQMTETPTTESIVTPEGENPKRGVKCACGYSWKTRTKLRYISCPNCRHTNKTEDAIAAYEGEPQQ